MTVVTQQKLTQVFLQEVQQIITDFTPDKIANPSLKKAYTHFQAACDPKNISFSNSLRLARNELNFAYGKISESDQRFFEACQCALKGTAYSIT